MDLQNVSNINVPQGEVRTIHDKDSRLLWGRVSYDTTYRGDTQQTTYTGKNLSSISGYTNIDWGTSKSDYLPIVNNLSAGTYTISMVFTLTSRDDTSDASCMGIYLQSSNSGGSFIDRSVQWGTKGVGQSTTFTTTFTISSGNVGSFTRVYFYGCGVNGVGKTGTANITNIQLEKGSSSTPYEPYVGGVPSPNPNYPQDIHTVSGEQKVSVRTGKNMIDLNSASVGYLVLHTNGELGPNPNYSASDWIPVKAGGHYYQTATNTWYSCYYDKNKNFIAQINSSNIRPTQDGYIRTSWENTKADQVMMEVGDSGTTYEPYMGKSYTVGLTTKNLLDPAKMQIGYVNNGGGISTSSTTGDMVTPYYIPVKPNSSVTMTIFETTSTYAPWFGCSEYTSTNEGSFVTRQVDQTAGITSATFTVGATTNYIRVSARNLQDASKYQLEYGASSTSYSPYFDSIELAKIGTYQDYIYKSSGNWYVHKATNKVIFKGTETWASFPSQNRVCFYTNVADGTGTLGMSDHYTYGTVSGEGYPALGGFMYNGDTNKNMLFRQNDDTTITTATDYKTWLQSHNVTVYYALATPTDTQITDVTLLSQLNAVHQWLTRYGYQYGVVGTLPIIIDQEDLS